MTQENSETRRESVADQLGVIRDDLAKLAGMVGEIATEKAHQANAAAADFADKASAKAEPYVAQAADRYAQAQNAVRRNPTLAVSIAAGAGALIARAILRR